MCRCYWTERAMNVVNIGDCDTKLTLLLSMFSAKCRVTAVFY